MSTSTQTSLLTEEEALQRDREDPLASYREAYLFPRAEENPYGLRHKLYFCGNSLGLQPAQTRDYLEEELQSWARMAVEGHFHAPRPWSEYHRLLAPATARIVGAMEEEVVVMNQLTVNLHLMMATFYRPQGKRFKILIESDAFPSDYQAVASQIAWHGYSPEEGVVKVAPRPGEACLRTEDILATIEAQGEALAMILLGGVNYYTGQFMDIPPVVEAAHRVGAYAGIDLAHAAGNVPLHLHDWGVDWAAWCTYKYLNSGPGSVSGVFIHRRHHQDATLPRLTGWWGHRDETRFEMAHRFDPIPTAEGWQLSNAPIMAMAPHLAALELFDRAGMEALRRKSVALTGALYGGLQRLGERYPEARLRILTPEEPAHRGAQISLLVPEQGRALFDFLQSRQLVADWRHPDVIRLAPTPMYNCFWEVYVFTEMLEEGLQHLGFSAVETP